MTTPMENVESDAAGMLEVEDRTSARPIQGVYRGGVVRLLEAAPWPDGCHVEVQLSASEISPEVPDIGRVIVAGYGLAGRWICEIFNRHNIEYVVVEQNPRTVEQLRKIGRETVLGDVSEESTLQSAGIEQAGILALTVPDEEAVLRATETARRLNPGIYIVARTNYTSSGMQATEFGADAVVKAEQAVANRFYELLQHKLCLGNRES